MKITKRLKRNLIADVENICELNLNEETRTSLMRCFEITIGAAARDACWDAQINQLLTYFK